MMQDIPPFLPPPPVGTVSVESLYGEHIVDVMYT